MPFLGQISSPGSLVSTNMTTVSNLLTDGTSILNWALGAFIAVSMIAVGVIVVRRIVKAITGR